MDDTLKQNLISAISNTINSGSISKADKRKVYELVKKDFKTNNISNSKIFINKGSTITLTFDPYMLSIPTVLDIIEILKIDYNL